MAAVAPASGPFFKRASEQGSGEQRFCFFHAPNADTGPRGCVLAVHAFAEEMNKTRAAAADGARALAAAGFAVLQIDLTGCGDSDGEFEDATWAAWLADLADGWEWLQAHCAGPRWVWGTRLGALLADQFVNTCTPAADGLLLWQPVVNGAQHLGQFLRLKTVSSLLREAASSDAATTPVARVAQPSPRADLASGLSIEVAGYRLTPLLADAIEVARLGAQEPSDIRVPSRVRWFEVSSQTSSAISPVAGRVADRWRSAGSDVVVATIVGNAFWQTQEVERCDALVEATVEALCA
jgi:exosortase A-associated hydrolase 2